MKAQTFRYLYRFFGVLFVISLFSYGSSERTRLFETDASAGWFKSLLTSDNLQLHDEVNDISDKIMNFLQNNAQGIFLPETKKERERLIVLGKKACENIKQIPDEYLSKSNAEYPEMWKTYLGGSIRLIVEGFENIDIEKIKEGTGLYNQFILWIQSKDRDDFKKLR
ncbi:MAG: hypothetical protein KKB51_02830 [Candidatus Riflebacteria bacterium]|nr:hypothetical protein [Candidatus Riflebacteria bacterium]